VRSGDTTALAAKTLSFDLALQPPAPGRVSVNYDSVYGVVHLSWSPVHVGDLKEYWIEFEDDPEITPNFGYNAWDVSDTAYDQGVMDDFGIYNTQKKPFTRTYWIRSQDVEGNLSPKGQGVSVRITAPTILKTEFSMHAIPDSVAPSQCLDTLAFALDVVSSPDSLVRVQWRGQAYYHDSESVDGRGSNTSNNTYNDSIRVSIGAPHRDTLYLTRQTLEGLGATGSRIAFDSVLVFAILGNQGDLVHSVTVPVRVDPQGCFHPSPGREESNGSLPY
jgi:hypothetical protein